MQDDGDGAEDCLQLNVFAPTATEPGAKLPVLLWIHGVTPSYPTPPIDGDSHALSTLISAPRHEISHSQYSVSGICAGAMPHCRDFPATTRI